MDIINTIEKYPLLKQKSAELNPETDMPLILQIQKALVDYLEFEKGAVGISAPQLAYFYQMFAIRFKNEILTFVNPVVEAYEGNTFQDWESCMSFPNIKVYTNRFTKLHVSYLTFNKTGKLYQQKNLYKKDMAIYFQHEYDHLNGELHLDNAPEEGIKIKVVKTPQIKPLYKVYDVNKTYQDDYFVEDENILFFNQDKIIPTAFPDKVMIGFKMIKD